MNVKLTNLFPVVIIGLSVSCHAMDNQDRPDSLEVKIASHLRSMEPRVSSKIVGYIKNRTCEDKKILWSIVIDDLEAFQKSRTLKTGPARMTLSASAANTVWLAYPALDRMFNLSGTDSSVFDPYKGTKVCLVEHMSPLVPVVEVINIIQFFGSLSLLRAIESTMGHRRPDGVVISDAARHFMAVAFICNSLFSIPCGPCLVDRAHNDQLGSFLVYYTIGAVLGLINAFLASSGDFPAAGRKEDANIRAVINTIRKHLRQERSPNNPV